MSFALVEAAGSANRPAVVGVIGCGNISHVYLRTINDSPFLKLKGCSGRNHATNAAQAELYGGVAMSIEELLADPEIDIVVNLTPPLVHHAIGRRILEAGKHLYNEKPLTHSLDEARDLIALASDKGLALGCAPDTWFGQPHQAARRAIDAGLIGGPVGGSLTMASHGMEYWHPTPEFFYLQGGGPMLDVAPYYLAQLVNLLGPIAEVTALASMPFATRTVTSRPGPRREIPVDVATSVNGALLMESGANIAFTISWDVWKHRRPSLEIYGEKGSLACPDANFFIGGYLAPEKAEYSLADGAWQSCPGQGEESPRDMAYAPLGGPRGLGVAEMAIAIAEGRPPRADAELAFHILETILAVDRSAREKVAIEVRSRPPRPRPL
ncbi:Gfo/Idh/MocA family oxidoreductase [Sphingopyxis sp.]|uniref:Gfo/Idh/MocA family protein n=1 Tax=Sphingopyxis sp. TaxID=1908224 RepID=UPI002EDB5AD4